MGDWAAALLTVFALVGCDDHALDWSIVPGDGLAESDVSAIEAEIVTGSCASPGEVVFAAASRLAEPSSAPGRLAPGGYAFRAWSTDGTCRVTAFGCTDVRLPQDGTVITRLEPTTSRDARCEVERCVAGLCTESRPDAGGVDAGACIEGQHCAGGSLFECRAGMTTITSCPDGCAPSGDRCGTMIPSNVDPDLITAAEGDALLGGVAIDTTTCDDAPWLTLATSVSGAPVCVLSGRNVRLSGTVVVTGNNPLVVLASESIEIAGTLDLAARGPSAGAGGAAGGPGDGGGPAGGPGGDANTEVHIKSGGAGGSLCGLGGAGGDSGGTASAAPLLGPAPIPYAETELQPLVGGSAGGAGGGLGVGGSAPNGGGGGGAVQLTALGTILLTGTIDVSGGGGRGGLSVGADGTPNAGGGGGSGGAVLIEARSISIGTTGVIRAAGGGGGGSGANERFGTDASGDPGQDGRLAGLGRATGGLGGAGTAATQGFAGGDGGGGGSPNASAGTDAARDAGDGGGGGGGAGCIVFRTSAPFTPVPATLNPTSAAVLPLRTQ